VTIGNSVTSIGDGAFGGCSRLTTITIPNSVISIGDSAFSSTSLTNITLGSGVTSIGVSAFSAVNYKSGRVFGCPLINITIPNSVTNIWAQAFAGCSSLTNITLGSGVTSIGDGAFVRCSSLTNITVDPLNSAFSSVDGVLFNQNQTTLVQYPGGKVGSYMIPNSVTNIGGSAFNTCFRLTGITIPNSVTSIGSGEFSGCSSLSNLDLGSGVTGIGDEAFSDCFSLTNVTIPTSVTFIGDSAFYTCTNLTSVYFQGNAPSLGGGVPFYNGVTLYYLPGTTGWGSTFLGLPTAVWTLPYPLVLTSNPGFGVRANQFGFTVSWATNLNMVVEATTDLANPIWSPVQTNALTSGSFYFSDPQWENYPSRFYRVRSQ
jgi:hypothetical protein